MVAVKVVEMTQLCFTPVGKLRSNAEAASGSGVGGGAGAPEGSGDGVDYAV